MQANKRHLTNRESYLSLPCHTFWLNARLFYNIRLLISSIRTPLTFSLPVLYCSTRGGGSPYHYKSRTYAYPVNLQLIYSLSATQTNTKRVKQVLQATMSEGLGQGP